LGCHNGGVRVIQKKTARHKIQTNAETVGNPGGKKGGGGRSNQAEGGKKKATLKNRQKEKFAE